MSTVSSAMQASSNHRRHHHRHLDLGGKNRSITLELSGVATYKTQNAEHKIPKNNSKRNFNLFFVYIFFLLHKIHQIKKKNKSEIIKHNKKYEKRIPSTIIWCLIYFPSVFENITQFL